jgi:sulfide:quinone oxidoreductase
MAKKIVVLGAGFGGLELVTRLSDALGDEVDITLIDKNGSFVFGFSKLDVMFGHKPPDAVRLHYKDIEKPGVRFKQESIESIDPEARRVTTDGGAYEADVLVIALGADLEPGATPGLLEGGGSEFYSVEGAERTRDVLQEFDGKVAVIGILGPFFKCPPAPFETAMMLRDFLDHRSMTDVDIKVLSPLPSPIPISKEASEGILEGLEEKNIEFWPQSKVVRLDPTRKIATVEDGREVPYDLFLAIPVHTAPAVVEKAGLTTEGWIAIDTATFATRFPGVYAIGDVTSAPVPRAGVFAEGEANTLADHLIAELRGGEQPPPYSGEATCYVEFGGGAVAKVEVEFLTGETPTGTFTAPSDEGAAEKKVFASSRAARWFGHSS